MSNVEAFSGETKKLQKRKNDFFFFLIDHHGQNYSLLNVLHSYDIM